jgi:2-polyprenyl-3-methyl-5-hydroxy-6-metoxy-1,4-benzoquinol methylase
MIKTFEKLIKKVLSIAFNLSLILFKRIKFFSTETQTRRSVLIESKKQQEKYIKDYFLDENGRVKINLTVQRYCPICDNNNSSVFFETFDGFRYVSCKNCGMIYTSKNLTSDAYNNFQKNLESHEESFFIERTIESDKDQKRFKKYIKLITKYKKKGELLDIGCYTGNFLKVAKSYGFSVSGVEIHLKKALIANKRGFNVICGNIEKCAINQKFDIITMWETLEHINNPKIVIEKIYDLLNPLGLFIFTVPNGSSINGRILTGHKMGFTGFGHKNLFTSNAVNYILKKYDFSILEQFTLENRFDSKNISDYFLGNFDYTDSFHNWNNLKKHRSSNFSQGISLLNILIIEHIIEKYKLGNLLFVIARKI